MTDLLLGQGGLSADGVLSPYVYVFYAAFALTFLLTPVMRVVALRFGIIDAPDGGARKVHAEPVAYLGGVAVFVGWLAGMTVSQFLRLHAVPSGWPTEHLIIKFSIVVGACVIVTLGLWDDVLGLRPHVKLLGQVSAALALLAEGVGTRCAEPLLMPLTVRVAPLLGLTFTPSAPPAEYLAFVYAVSSVLVIGLVVFCCNATNLMDGLDGLCGGVTAIIAAGFLFVAVHLAMSGQALNTNWDAMRIVLGLALLGAVLGFVPYNFNPASIFMGDTGSMLLGYCCAVQVILMAQERPRWFLAAMVMFALPVLDTLLAFTRRWVAGRSVFSPDKRHFHHQLVARGYTVRQTVLIAYALAVGFAALGAAIVFMRTRYAVAVYMVVFGSIIVAAYKMGMVHERLTADADGPRPAARGDTAPAVPDDAPAKSAPT